MDSGGIAQLWQNAADAQTKGGRAGGKKGLCFSGVSEGSSAARDHRQVDRSFRIVKLLLRVLVRGRPCTSRCSGCCANKCFSEYEAALLRAPPPHQLGPPWAPLCVPSLHSPLHPACSPSSAAVSALGGRTLHSPSALSIATAAPVPLTPPPHRPGPWRAP